MSSSIPKLSPGLLLDNCHCSCLPLHNVLQESRGCVRWSQPRSAVAMPAKGCVCLFSCGCFVLSCVQHSMQTQRHVSYQTVQKTPAANHQPFQTSTFSWFTIFFENSELLSLQGLYKHRALHESWGSRNLRRRDWMSKHSWVASQR